MRSEGLPQHERHQEIRAPEREDGGSRGEELSRKEFTEMSLDCVPDRWRKAPTLTHTVVISEAKSIYVSAGEGRGNRSHRRRIRKPFNDDSEAKMY